MKLDPSLKGLVLAAGLGTRLRPLTDHWPKPLIPFLGTNPLKIALGLLERSQISSVAINTHYQAEKILQFLESLPLDQRPFISHEPNILGTGGVYNPLREWIGESDLLVINGDIIANVDISSTIKHHRSSKAIATMVVLPKVIPGENAVFFRNNRILDIGKITPVDSQAGNFACVQILSRDFIDLLPASGNFDIISQGYLKALEIGAEINAIVHNGVWHDIGSIQKYAAAIFDLVQNRSACASLGIDLTQCKVTPDGGVVEPGALVGEGALIKRSVILPGGKVLPHECIDNLIICDNNRISFT